MHSLCWNSTTTKMGQNHGGCIPTLLTSLNCSQLDLTCQLRALQLLAEAKLCPKSTPKIQELTWMKDRNWQPV